MSDIGMKGLQDMNEMKLSIVVPCYNEQENIPLILERFSQCVEGKNIEVILVNNGSTDESAQVLEKLLPNYEFAKTILVPVNQGYGYGILQGLKNCTGDYIGWTHADMQTDPADVIKAYKIIDRNPAQKVFVKGRRTKRPLADSFFTFGMGIYESVYLKQKLFDINAQPNLFPRSFFESWKNPPYDFSLDLYAMFMARKANLKIIRFKVIFPERIHGESHWNFGMKSKWKFIRRTLSFSKKLKRGGIS
jgi:glycosyltransferase involved in cell wall biosynthesis